MILGKGYSLMGGITRWLRSVLLNATHFTVRSGVKMAQERRGAGATGRATES
jgi:hypothetical protein